MSSLSASALRRCWLKFLRGFFVVFPVLTIVNCLFFGVNRLLRGLGRLLPGSGSGRVSARSMAFDSFDEFSWLEGLWFDRTNVPKLVCIGSLSCVGVPLRAIADGGVFVIKALSQCRARS